MGDTSLSSLQLRLFEGVRQLPGTTSIEEPAEDLIRNQPPLSSFERLEIYRTGHWLRIFESLKEDFPRTEKLLGEVEFEKLCWGFVTEAPSRFPSLAEYSGDLSTYMKHSKWGIHYPGIEELARFEWTLVRKDYEEAPQAMDLASLAQAEDQSAFLIRRNPTAETIAFGYAVQSEAPLLPSSVLIVFFSSQGGIETLVLRPGEKEILNFLSESRSIAELAEFATGIELESETLRILFSDWVVNGMIING